MAIGTGTVPFKEGTDSQGGYLVRDQYGDTLLDAVLRESSILSLCRVDRVVGKRQKYSIYTGRPSAAFVDEGAAKPVTAAGFSNLDVNVKKIAANVIYTQEILEDAQVDPRVLVNADVEAAFSDLIDSHAIGKSNGTNLTTSFDKAIRATTSTKEYVASNPDSLATIISGAMTVVESNGYKPNGIMLTSDARGHLRDARYKVETSTPLYTDGFNREPDSLYGLPISYSSNLSSFGATAAATKIIGFVGDFSQVVCAMRSDLNVRFSDQATIVDGGTTHNLWQENKVAAQWEMRLGLNVHDIDKSIVALVDAS
jgi:HK97 family phage major capsid protein